MRASLLQTRICVHHSGDDVGALCAVREGDSEGVYLVRGSVLSLLFVEPNTRDRLKKPDGPDPRYAPGNVGLQDIARILTLERKLDQVESCYSDIPNSEMLCFPIVRVEIRGQ